jgi:hypothetical protein
MGAMSAQRLPAAASGGAARLQVSLDEVSVRRVLSRIRVWPITLEVAVASTRSDVGGDPRMS